MRNLKLSFFVRYYFLQLQTINNVSIMLCIILWTVLILIIVIYACPGFLTFLLCVGIPVGIAIFALVSWIQNKLTK